MNKLLTLTLLLISNTSYSGVHILCCDGAYPVAYNSYQLKGDVVFCQKKIGSKLMRHGNYKVVFSNGEEKDKKVYKFDKVVKSNNQMSRCKGSMADQKWFSSNGPGQSFIPSPMKDAKLLATKSHPDQKAIIASGGGLSFRSKKTLAPNKKKDLLLAGSGETRKPRSKKVECPSGDSIKLMKQALKEAVGQPEKEPCDSMPKAQQLLIERENTFNDRLYSLGSELYPCFKPMFEIRKIIEKMMVKIHEHNLCASNFSGNSDWVKTGSNKEKVFRQKFFIYTPEFMRIDVKKVRPNVEKDRRIMKVLGKAWNSISKKSKTNYGKAISNTNKEFSRHAYREEIAKFDDQIRAILY